MSRKLWAGVGRRSPELGCLWKLETFPSHGERDLKGTTSSTLYCLSPTFTCHWGSHYPGSAEASRQTSVAHYCQYTCTSLRLETRCHGACHGSPHSSRSWGTHIIMNMEPQPSH